jgi:hypothetical protein
MNGSLVVVRKGHHPVSIPPQPDLLERVKANSKLRLMGIECGRVLMVTVRLTDGSEIFIDTAALKVEYLDPADKYVVSAYSQIEYARYLANRMQRAGVSEKACQGMVMKAEEQLWLALAGLSTCDHSGGRSAMNFGMLRCFECGELFFPRTFSERGQAEQYGDGNSSRGRKIQTYAHAAHGLFED